MPLKIFKSLTPVRKVQVTFSPQLPDIPSSGSALTGTERQENAKVAAKHKLMIFFICHTSYAILDQYENPADKTHFTGKAPAATCILEVMS